MKPVLGLTAVLAISLMLLLGQSSARATGQTSAPGNRLNIVVIMTDDQRWDTLCGVDGLTDICSRPVEEHPMPVVETMLMQAGLVFVNAFAGNPLCCPARASFLSGGFSSPLTNVLSNELPNGSVISFQDSVSLATRLQEAGYTTALIGKYINGYGPLANAQPDDPYVPPGWDRFVVWVKYAARGVNSVVVGSSPIGQPGSGSIISVAARTHSSDYERDEALAFLDDLCQFQHCQSPFFLLVSTNAPHRPALPADRHAGLFSGYLYRERGWDEQPDGNLSDKPLYVQVDGLTNDPAADDAFHTNQLENLRSVDEAIDAILTNLIQKDLLDQTVVIFVSDNGMMWGEHRLFDKTKPYEESIRVPLVIRHPGVTPRYVANLVDFSIDLPATILEIAGAELMGNEGMSLVPLFDNPNASWRRLLLLQGWDNMSARLGLPSWAAVRTDTGWKYVEYVTGEKELYKLSADPYELDSRHNKPQYAPVMAELAAQLALLNRGVAIRTDNLPNPQFNQLPNGRVNRPYSFTFQAWGGSNGYTWHVHVDAVRCLTSLPPGLSLSTSGELSGTPTLPGTYRFCVIVADGSVSPQPGNSRPQQHIKEFQLTFR